MAFAMRPIVGVCALTAFLGGTACMPQPKSPADFRRAVREGGVMRRFEERTVPRGFQATFAAVSQNADRCFNAVKHTSTPGKYGPESQSLMFRATTKAPTAGRGEIAVQMNAANLIGDVPEGGVYILVADVEEQGAAASKVGVYAAGKGGDLAESIFAWAAGGKDDCPDL